MLSQEVLLGVGKRESAWNIASFLDIIGQQRHSGVPHGVLCLWKGGGRGMRMLLVEGWGSVEPGSLALTKLSEMFFASLETEEWAGNLFCGWGYSGGERLLRDSIDVNGDKWGGRVLPLSVFVSSARLRDEKET